MPELRWTLLILGALFIAALAWWELRKPRQARRGDIDLRGPPSSNREPEIEPSTTRVYREPTINLPEVRPRTMSTAELPVIEVKDDTMIGLRIDGQTIDDDERETPPIAEEAILRSEREPTSTRESLSTNDIDWRIEDEEREITWTDEPAADAKPAKPTEAAKPLEAASAPAEEIFVEEFSPPSPREALAHQLGGDSEHAEPKVEWPEDAERTILSLRLVASADRFSGRAVRQTLMAEGFALGKMDIFHKPGPDGRAIISATSLTRPGTFSLETIDTQRFTGVNLFSVLPGPLPGLHTFDELLATARSMNERLRGGLQDDTGQPLTPTRIASIRSMLTDMPAMAPLEAEPPVEIPETSEAQSPETPPP
jgi:FtsZ-interacting cell division protein ZipA